MVIGGEREGFETYMSHSPRGAASDKTRPCLKQTRPRVAEKGLPFAQTGFGRGRFGGQAFALASRTRSGAIHMQMPEFFYLCCTGLVQQTPSHRDVLCAVICLVKNSYQNLGADSVEIE
jgi:hypothetical protein